MADFQLPLSSTNIPALSLFLKKITTWHQAAGIRPAKEDKGSFRCFLCHLCQIPNRPCVALPPQPEHLLNATENVTVQCHAPSVIIRTVAAEDISPPASQAEMSADSDMQPVDLAGTPTSLETDSFPEDLHPSKLPGGDPSAFSAVGSSKFGSQNSPELLGRAGVDILNSDLKREDNCPSDLAGTYVSEVREKKNTTCKPSELRFMWS